MKTLFFNSGRYFNATVRTLPALLLLAGMASCSDESPLADQNGGNGYQPTELEKSALSIFTDPADMPSRVLNFSFGKSGSRAINPDIDLDAYLKEVQNIDLSKLVELKDVNFYYNPDSLDYSKLVVSGEYKGALENFG
ncbi:MAG: hypothetical protein K2J94_10225, partial [Duncaniella sp.]|nr:hypothetical protein [Duncaniella sp.]